MPVAMIRIHAHGHKSVPSSRLHDGNVSRARRDGADPVAPALGGIREAIDSVSEFVAPTGAALEELSVASDIRHCG
jgi:hypothetical protein